MASPVYRREAQRVIFGLVTKRQRNILIAGVFFVFFFIRAGSQLNESDYTWKVTVSQNDLSAMQSKVVDDWGALPEPNEENIETETAIQAELPIEIKSLFYSDKVGYVNWDEAPLAPSGKENMYRVYINEQFVGETLINSYRYDFAEGEEKPPVDPVIALRIVVFMIFALIAFIDINGTHPEKYALHFFKQYYKFETLFKIPILGLSVALPRKKQVIFHLSKPPVKGNQLVDQLPVGKKKTKLFKPLQKDQVIEKVLASYEHPIQFSSKLDVLEIEHDHLMIQIKRNDKGGIEIALRDK
jgi:hypothetical protein